LVTREAVLEASEAKSKPKFPPEEESNL